jgi:Rad3-related DNA helicase
MPVFAVPARPLVTASADAPDLPADAALEDPSGGVHTTVAVRALCEFTAKEGDLDHRFTPSATALEGQAGHQLVVSRRGADYESEVTLSAVFSSAHGTLTVRGRADGFDAERGRLEEIKTFRGDLSLMPPNRRALHEAQAQVYGAMLCAERGLAQLEVALVYLDVASWQETVMAETFSAADLQAVFSALCARYAAWAAQEQAHRLARDAALRALTFPHGDFRPGQRALSEAVYRAAVRGQVLMAQAPTGIGKTVDTLFPLLKAMPTQGLDKLLCLTAKTPGRQIALQALASVRAHAPGLPLRAIELVARDTACEHPDKAGHGDSCPLARGFYDRLHAARLDALDLPVWDQPALRQLGRQHQICPYYLGHELVRWADVIVGDYNHHFDSAALLHGLTVALHWRVALWVDEAHNLLDRARGMYSAALTFDALTAVRESAPKPLRAPLGKLLRAWDELPALPDGEAYSALTEVPPPMLAALQQFNTAVGEHQAKNPRAPSGGLGPELLRVYFDTLAFTRLLDTFGEHSVLDLTPPHADAGFASAPTLTLRNLVPAPHLKPRWAAAHSAVLFSATLSPAHYHADLLGLPEGTPWVDVEAPFEAAQLQVQIVGHIPMRWSERAASVGPLADLMAAQYAARPGNYLAFFSSFEHLAQVAERLRFTHPQVPLWQQARAMGEAARSAFLARFVPEGQGIGFAVLGGAFAEGIDLPGTRLIGAFIATLGLPQLNPVNEQLKARMEALYGAGHDYAYLYPGLQKVVQAAGRVIRTPSDEGTVVLIDPRYARAQVRNLLPHWWAVPGRR